MGSWTVRSVCLRYSVLRTPYPLLSPVFGVFSIRLALRVTSQNRIFANGVNRQFPAPDFNRLAALLPRRTVKLVYLLINIGTVDIHCLLIYQGVAFSLLFEGL